MILFRLLFLLARAFLLPFFRWRFRAGVPKGAWASLVIDGAVEDLPEPTRFWSLRRKETLSLHGLSEMMTAIIANDRVRGLLVTLKSIGGGMATATSLRAELARVRAAGKEVVVQLPLGGGSKELYVALAGTRIYVGPQTSLAPIGFSTSVRYVKGALDKAGLVPEVLARGEFKSAGEQLIRDRMSDRQREQLSAIFDGAYGELLSAIETGRGVTKERAIEIVDGAPYRAHAAIEAKLVDGAAYEDEIPALLGTKKAPAKTIDATVIHRMHARTRLPSLRRKPVIGVVRVHGAIATAGPLSFRGASDEKIIGAIRAARKNRRVRAVILHIDSPGGSALASDRIHHELVQLAAEKPLVACMANVAASGGYYVAAAAHEIVAQPTTITGSIGVVAARVVVGPLFERLGIVTETVKRGARADMLDPSRTFTEDERAALQRELEATYEAFVGIVADGRKLSREVVEKVAEGRVWSGLDAKTHKLVDVLGGFDVALARARALTKSPNDALPPALIKGPREPGPPLPPPAAAAAEIALRVLDLDLALWTHERDRVLAWSPIAASIAR